MSDWRTITQGFSERVSPEEQKRRDREALAIKRAERETATGRDAAALDREIARDVKRIGDKPTAPAEPVTQDWRAITRTFQPMPEAPVAPPEPQDIPRYNIARGVKRTARSQVDPFESLARGAVSGMTAGLDKYIAAPAMVGLDLLAGKGDLTLQQALEELRAQERLDRAVNPTLTTAGNIAGAIAPLSRFSAVQQPLKTTLASGAYGATSGFTANPMAEGTTLQDTLVGGGFGLLGGGAQAGVASAVNKRLTNAALQGARDAQRAINTGALHSLREGAVKLPEEIVQQNQRQVFALGGDFVMKGGKRLTKKGEDYLNNLNARELVSRATPEQLTEFARMSPDKVPTRGLVSAVGGIAPSTITGGVIGGLGAPFVGQDPLAGAIAGAGAGFGLAKGRAIDAVKEAALRKAASFATLSGVPQLGSVVSPVVTGATAAAPGEFILRGDSFQDLSSPVRQTLSERLGLR